MTWVKLDDGFFRNPKVLGLTKDARLLYLAGLCHCASSLTDGHITNTALRLVAAEADVRPTMAAKLVTAGLWDRADDGYRVHDYLAYNPSRADVHADREAAKERMRRARAARGNGKRSAERSGEQPPEQPPEQGENFAGSSPNPVPSRPPVLPSSSNSRPPQPPPAGAEAPRRKDTNEEPTDRVTAAIRILASRDLQLRQQDTDQAPIRQPDRYLAECVTTRRQTNGADLAFLADTYPDATPEALANRIAPPWGEGAAPPTQEQTDRWLAEQDTLDAQAADPAVAKAELDKVRATIAARHSDDTAG